MRRNYFIRLFTTIKNKNIKNNIKYTPNNSNSNKNKKSQNSQTKNENENEKSWSVIQTTTDSVFTINEMDKDLDFGSWTAEASKLFQCNASYISPKEFNYQLPIHGVPEYAFVGK